MLTNWRCISVAFLRLERLENCVFNYFFQRQVTERRWITYSTWQYSSVESKINKKCVKMFKLNCYNLLVVEIIILWLQFFTVSSQPISYMRRTLTVNMYSK